jgi:hypothetical protein
MNRTMAEWETYEEVAAYLLNSFREHFSIERVEGKQDIPGTTWRIDAKAVTEGGEGFLIVERRRYKDSRIAQEAGGGLAWCIIDTGAFGGILVSPLGFQKGAAKVAAATNVKQVMLNEDSTEKDFAFGFLDNLFMGINVTVTTKVSVFVRYLWECPKCHELYPDEKPHTCRVTDKPDEPA